MIHVLQLYYFPVQVPYYFKEFKFPIQLFFKVYFVKHNSLPAMQTDRVKSTSLSLSLSICLHNLCPSVSETHTHTHNIFPSLMLYKIVQKERHSIYDVATVQPHVPSLLCPSING